MALDLSILNPEQRAAVTTTEGPVLVLAGAGSGKTRVITTRAVHLIESRRAAPGEILALTFTNKAAREMAGRVAAMTKGRKEKPLLCTFHSLGVRLLRECIHLIGYRPQFIIFDSDDQLSLVKNIIEEEGFDNQLLSPADVHFAIQKAKSEGVPATDLLARHDSPRDLFLGKIMRRYQTTLQRLNAVDFEDILQLSLRLFKEHPEPTGAFFTQFRYVMVDEYQDTNKVQYDLLKGIIASHGNLCVVGDDDQSIYGWRGAEPGNIRTFTEDFPQARVVRLERNYRSTGTILAAANQVIARNDGRMEKSLRATLGKGVGLEWLEGVNETDELEKMVTHLRLKRLREGGKFSDFAVLYRSNFQSRGVEEALRMEGIPYVLVGGTRFYERREIKDAISYLRLIYQPLDEVSLLRVINFPRRGIGRVSVTRLMDYAAHQQRPPIEVMAEAANFAEFDPAAARAMERLVDLLNRYRKQMETRPLGEVFRELMAELDFHGAVEKEKGDSKSAEKASGLIHEMERALDFYTERRPESGLKDYLEHVALMTLPEDENPDKRPDMVTLLTVHSAKGLEFPHVYVVHLADDLFPHKRSLSEGGEEEERRLFYVAVTRAQHSLVFSMAKERKRYGELIKQRPSRFLLDLDPELFEGPAPGSAAGEARAKREVKAAQAKERFFQQMREMRASGGE